MKKVFKNPIIMFILGALIFGGVGTVFGYSILANNVGFTPKDSSWNVDNVENAINDLKDIAYNKMNFGIQASNALRNYTNPNTITQLNVTKGNYIVISADTHCGGSKNAQNSATNNTRNVSITNGSCSLLNGVYSIKTANVSYGSGWLMTNYLMTNVFKCKCNNNCVINGIDKDTSVYSGGTDPHAAMLKTIKIN